MSMFARLKQTLFPKRARAKCRQQTHLGVELLEDRSMLSVGHAASFFRAEEASGPIVDYTIAETRALEIDSAYAALEKIDSDTLAYGFWTQEERSPQSWRDFRAVLERLQTDYPQKQVLAYVGSPAYAGDGMFCWEEHSSDESCSDAGRYDDYERWSREVALVSLKFPIVQGILLDDFNGDMQRDDGVDKTFTPLYVESVRSIGRGIDSDFRVEAIQYLPSISAYDAKRFEHGLDAVHFFYRHFDGQGIDVDPDRIAIEIEMFERAYSSSEVSPLATIYHPSDQRATVGDVVAVTAMIDLEEIEADLNIAHFDSIPFSEASRGWVQRTITFGGNVVYDADIADDSLDVHVITISQAQIESLRSGGTRMAELQMELTVTQSFSRWNYAANIFVSQPDDVYVDWTSIDTHGTNVVVTGNDLETPPERFIGLYGGSPSFMTVTPDYTQRVLDHSRAAYEAGAIEGITVWEVMMNDTASEIFQSYQDYFVAVSLDQELELFSAGSLHENWGGANEKWISGNDAAWYYILPSGDLHEWDGAGLTGQLVASFDPIYHAEPQRLFAAAPDPRLSNAGLLPFATVAAHFDDRLMLHAAAEEYENWGGRGEKWLQGENRQWYFITPDGALYEWDGQRAASGRFVARLSPIYHAHLELLYDAHANAVDAFFELMSADDRWDNWGGLGEKWIQGDGRWFYLLPNGTLWQWQATTSAGLTGTQVAALDSSYYEDPDRLVNAQTRYLSTYLGFHESGNLWQNWGGKQEKWLLGRDQRWYFLTPDGLLHRWDEGQAATGELVAILDAASYDDLSWLSASGQ